MECHQNEDSTFGVIVIFILILAVFAYKPFMHEIAQKKLDKEYTRRAAILVNKQVEFSAYSANRQLIRLKLPGKYLTKNYLKSIAKYYDKNLKKQEDYQSTNSTIRFNGWIKKRDAKQKQYSVTARLLPLTLLPASTLKKINVLHKQTDIKDTNEYHLNHHVVSDDYDFIKSEDVIHSLVDLYGREAKNEDVYFQCDYLTCEGQVYLPNKNLNFTLAFPRHAMPYWEKNLNSFVKLIEKHQVNY